MEVQQQSAQESPTPLVLTAAEAAAIFHKSARTWRNWDSTGKIPRPIRIGRIDLLATGRIAGLGRRRLPGSGNVGTAPIVTIHPSHSRKIC